MSRGDRGFHLAVNRAIRCKRDQNFPLRLLSLKDEFTTIFSAPSQRCTLGDLSGFMHDAVTPTLVAADCFDSASADT